MIHGAYNVKLRDVIVAKGSYSYKDTQKINMLHVIYVMFI